MSINWISGRKMKANLGSIFSIKQISHKHKKKDFVYFITAKQPPASADKTKTIGDWKGAM